jgi:hypothetical protein
MEFVEGSLKKPDRGEQKSYAACNQKSEKKHHTNCIRPARPKMSNPNQTQESEQECAASSHT